MQSIVPSFDLRNGMDELFMGKLAIALHECAARNVIMHPYFGVRNPVRQAKLWRQSRKSTEIRTQIEHLHMVECTYLADCIEAAGPQHGPWVTNAMPGLSWHQYGVAMDCVWVSRGKPCWDTHVEGPLNGYKVYEACGIAAGLTSLASIGDVDHLQLYKEGSPNHKYGISEIDKMMRDKFGPIEHLA